MDPLHFLIGLAVGQNGSSTLPFNRLGYEVKLIATQYVKPFVKGNQNDYNDAEAIE